MKTTKRAHAIMVALTFAGLLGGIAVAQSTGASETPVGVTPGEIAEGVSLPAPDVTTTFTDIPCPTEDSNGCLWDAQESGNGRGDSFYADSDGNLYFHRDRLDVWEKRMRAEGFAKVRGNVHGHRNCYSAAPDGNTAFVACWDGYVTLS